MKIPLKKEPQSLHWSGIEIIVHYGILKKGGSKEYHCYLSDDLIQDHAFVNLVLDEMIDEINHDQLYIIVVSENCTAQYKCAAHFENLRKLAARLGVTVIRVYGIAGHGKGEVDHVGGLTKLAVRRAVGAGTTMRDSEFIVNFLNEKFGDKSEPIYVFKNITCEDIEEERAEERYVKYMTVEGSSKFQVLVFAPGKKMKASRRLCICEKCKNEYGSCSLFQEYEIVMQQLKRTCLRSGMVASDNLGIDFDGTDQDKQDKVAAEMLTKGAVVVIAADPKDQCNSFRSHSDNR